MCRLVGLIRASETPIPSWYHLVGAPNSLRKQAETGRVPKGTEPGHTDSWGIGWFDDRNDVSLIRQTGSAADSAFFVFAAETASRGGAASGVGKIVVGHLRKASVGGVSSENAHPIRADYHPSSSGDPSGRPYETLLVAHNGTIKKPLLDFLRQEVMDGGREEGRADSDTVLLSGYLAHCLSTAPTGDTFAALSGALRELFETARFVAAGVAGGDLTKMYTGVNLLLAHPSGLYALRQFSDSAEYYTLFARPLTPDGDEGATGYLIASEPTDKKQGWEPLTPGVLTHFAPDGSVHTDTVG
ncbi:MAG: class II glutamine amidotransferase [Akkermansiaceae bacterium]|nr:class II glutamine amidotransferase [Armatimonadota bacterium]